uniref:Uncharacterized protein n=1 Tax=Rhizophora mucronata TaxID=61149 RepID=A0A2P2NS83_RHIMU
MARSDLGKWIISLCLHMIIMSMVTTIITTMLHSKKDFRGRPIKVLFSRWL